MQATTLGERGISAAQVRFRFYGLEFWGLGFRVQGLGPQASWALPKVSLSLGKALVVKWFDYWWPSTGAPKTRSLVAFALELEYSKVFCSYC